MLFEELTSQAIRYVQSGQRKHISTWEIIDLENVKMLLFACHSNKIKHRGDNM